LIARCQYNITNSDIKNNNKESAQIVREQEARVIGEGTVKEVTGANPAI
jgi:hypothetical protein